MKVCLKKNQLEIFDYQNEISDIIARLNTDKSTVQNGFYSRNNSNMYYYVKVQFKTKRIEKKLSSFYSDKF